MDEGTFRRIIDECAVERCREVHLHNFGEPLLDKNLENRVRYAKKAGIEKVKIFSNGALLTEKRAKGLIEAGLDEIKVSMDGATRDEFERIRVPLKYDAVVENIRRLVAYRNEVGSRLRIKFACVSTSDKEATIQSLEKIVDRFSFGKIHNWNGEDIRRRPRRNPKAVLAIVADVHHPGRRPRFPCAASTTTARSSSGGSTRRTPSGPSSTAPPTAACGFCTARRDRRKSASAGIARRRFFRARWRRRRRKRAPCGTAWGTTRDSVSAVFRPLPRRSR